MIGRRFCHFSRGAKTLTFDHLDHISNTEESTSYRQWMNLDVSRSHKQAQCECYCLVLITLEFFLNW